MPPRDVATLGAPFLVVTLFAGPLVLGAGLAAVTRLLPPGVTETFDRVAMAGLAAVLLLALALVPRSRGWSTLFVLPYAAALLGIILFRWLGPPPRRG